MAPPLTIGADEVDFALTVLDEALATVSAAAPS
jgi:4-aminobutyrate aminotransferase-like enzyme